MTEPEETGTIRLEDEQERILALKVDLEGPAEVVSWVRENARPRMGMRVFHFLPPGFRQHMRAAQREQLLALRSLLDAMIGRLEEKPDTGKGKKAVEVEVE